MSRRTFRIGTRGSRLALLQTEIALAALRAACPDLAYEVKTVPTQGDLDARTSLAAMGGRSVFVAELERALLQGEIDMAVHSLKDLPTRLPEGLTVAAVPQRADPRDALVSRGGEGLGALPPGAVVGTGSPRRAAQLQNLRPDIVIADIRGNVDTRIRKVREGQYAAAVLAAAGLERLGLLGEAVELFDPDVFLPAAGQGAIAIEVRADDVEALALARAADDPRAHACVRAERAFERRLGGGCHAAVAALATWEGDRMRLRGLVADPAATVLLRAEACGLPEEAESLGERLAERLLAQGAEALMSRRP